MENPYETAFWERRSRALISLAGSSVGSKQATHAYKLHLNQLLDEYDLACRQLATVETAIIAVLDRIPFAKSMFEVKGISAISLAGILGEAGDLSGIVHGNALLRLASTSQKQAQANGPDRSATPPPLHLLMAMSLVANNPEFKAMHAYNVTGKKDKENEIMKLCGKLARVTRWNGSQRRSLQSF
ncbi:hypothetical protein V3851_23570 [Paenibacillus sp. M1]|uniref:Transposase IS116/IS110/IS902 family protein n=1 Tax=Paenibacillus haidiansis TaxID=1574488 RepID=A0ABU7VYE4_9BACL